MHSWRVNRDSRGKGMGIVMAWVKFDVALYVIVVKPLVGQVGRSTSIRSIGKSGRRCSQRNTSNKTFDEKTVTFGRVCNLRVNHFPEGNVSPITLLVSGCLSSSSQQNIRHQQWQSEFIFISRTIKSHNSCYASHRHAHARTYVHYSNGRDVSPALSSWLNLFDRHRGDGQQQKVT